MKVLCVIDMQNDFIDGVFGTPEAKAIVPKVVEKIKEYENDKIILTMDEHDGEHTEEIYKLQEHCKKNTHGWKFHESLKFIHDTEPFYTNSFVIKKNTFASISMIKEIIWICKGLPESVEIVGLVTDVCVISAALLLRSAFPSIPIKVDSSCCAGTTPEKHKMALEIMKTNLIEVV